MVKMSSIDENCAKIEKELIQKFDTNSRIAIVGIGNEIRYDDIAGLQVVRNLKKKSKMSKSNKSILLIEGETGPHLFFNEIHDWNPTHVILLDSADLKKKPGTIEFVQREELPYISISSHSYSKQLLLDFLFASILNLEIIIICIQAENIFYEKGISKKVKLAVDKLTDVFIRLFFE